MISLTTRHLTTRGGSNRSRMLFAFLGSEPRYDKKCPSRLHKRQGLGVIVYPRSPAQELSAGRGPLQLLNIHYLFSV